MKKLFLSLTLISKKIIHQIILTLRTLLTYSDSMAFLLRLELAKSRKERLKTKKTKK
jgi:hypothetical protein